MTHYSPDIWEILPRIWWQVTPLSKDAHFHSMQEFLCLAPFFLSEYDKERDSCVVQLAPLEDSKSDVISQIWQRPREIEACPDSKESK